MSLFSDITSFATSLPTQTGFNSNGFDLAQAAGFPPAHQANSISTQDRSMLETFLFGGSANPNTSNPNYADFWTYDLIGGSSQQDSGTVTAAQVSGRNGGASATSGQATAAVSVQSTAATAGMFNDPQGFTPEQYGRAVIINEVASKALFASPTTAGLTIQANEVVSEAATYQAVPNFALTTFFRGAQEQAAADRISQAGLPSRSTSYALMNEVSKVAMGQTVQNAGATSALQQYAASNLPGTPSSFSSPADIGTATMRAWQHYTHNDPRGAAANFTSYPDQLRGFARDVLGVTNPTQFVSSFINAEISAMTAQAQTILANPQQFAR